MIGPVSVTDTLKEPADKDSVTSLLQLQAAALSHSTLILWEEGDLVGAPSAAS